MTKRLPESTDRGIARSIRELPPAHYKMKVESFSLLSNLLHDIRVDKYESRYFEIDGYKWFDFERLSLYPDGDKKRNGTGHISLYLVLAETNNLPLGSELNVVFKFFVYDQIRDKYLIIEDVSKNGRRFHAMKTEWGFSKLLPLSTFNDSANGYLVDDCAIFGAEVFVRNSTCKGENISLIKNPIDRSLVWKIDNFSSLIDERITSEVFAAGGYKWFLCIYPKGYGRVKGKSLSLFLNLKDDTGLEPGHNLYVEYELRIEDQLHNNHPIKKGKNAFCSSTKGWGYTDFMLLSDLRDTSKGFILHNAIIVVGEVKVLSEVNNFFYWVGVKWNWILCFSLARDSWENVEEMTMNPGNDADRVAYVLRDSGQGQTRVTSRASVPFVKPRTLPAIIKHSSLNYAYQSYKEAGWVLLQASDK
ncbi:hypothetical protein LguiB_022085 [Lonicera macranthoides]